MKPLHWKLLGGAVLVALVYYAIKPTASFTFYDPEVVTAMAPATAAGVGLRASAADVS